MTPTRWVKCGKPIHRRPPQEILFLPPCTHCSAGWVPSDEEVIEAAVAMSRVPEGPGLALNAQVWPKLARAALIAADRWRQANG